MACVVFVIVSGCGQSYYFAGRTLPPSGILNRALVTIQNPAPGSQGGSLEIEDAFYDIRHSFNNKTPSFFIGGFAAVAPETIQNMPAETLGAVYSQDGSLALINYAEEKQIASITLASTSPTTGAGSGSGAGSSSTNSTAPTVNLPGLSSSIYITADERYVIAANPQQRVVTVIDRSLPGTYELNLPNASRVSLNPGGSVALIFVQDSNLVYSLLRLQIGQAAPSNAEDCEPQNLPVYCLMPVTGTFDRPVKAVYSPDGNTAYVLNCGLECGGHQASVSYLPTAGILIQSGTYVPPGSNTMVTATVPVPGGVTDALTTGNTLYLAGQQLQGDGYFAGELSVLDAPSQQITGPFPISDGTHSKMIQGDDNTLWIGSQLCAQGERFQQNKNGANVQFGCLTMFNTATNSVTMVDSYKGDATGIAAITDLGKVFTTEGGQVYIYSTTDGSALDNSNVTVVGTASDVAYMDAPADNNNTNY